MKIVFNSVVAFICAVSLFVSCLPLVEADVVNMTIPERKIVWNQMGVALGSNYILGLNTDGTVYSTASGTADADLYYSRVEFEGKMQTGKIVEVCATDTHVVGLRDDGRVEATTPKSNLKGQQRVTDWTDIVAISANIDHTVGLKSDGKVVSTTPISGSNGQELVSTWTDIVKVVAGRYNTIGLKKDGTVVFTKMTNKPYSHAEVSNWGGIVDIETTEAYTVGLRADGTVVSTSYEDKNYNYGIDTWKNVVGISASSNATLGYTVGVKADGTVYMTDNNSPFSVASDTVKSTVAQWTDIAKVYAGVDYVVGLKKDGTLTFATNNTAKKQKFLQISRTKLDKTIQPTISYSYGKNDQGNYGYFASMAMYSGYDLATYKIYSTTDSTQQPFDANEPDKNLYAEPVFTNEVTTFKMVIVKEVKTEGTDIIKRYPSNVFSLSVKQQDINPTITASVEPGVYNSSSIDLGFKVIYKNSEIDGYDIYWVYGGNAVDNEPTKYTQPLKFNDDVELIVWAELKQDGVTKIKSENFNFKYVLLNEVSNKFPKPEYDSKYTPEEIADKNNGKVVVKRNSVAVQAGSNISMVLNTNGTVNASYMKGLLTEATTNLSAACPDSLSTDISKWTDKNWVSTPNWRMISDIAVGNEHAVGLRLDGTVISAGRNTENQCETSTWKDIVDVDAGAYHTVGLKKDGSVVSTATEKVTYDFGQAYIGLWKDIVAIDANNLNTVGLKKDGTVVAAGSNSYGQTNVDSWSDIVAISSGTNHTVGLKKDGSVVAVGDNGNYQCNVSGWKNVVSISAGATYTLAITYDGRLLHTGINRLGDNMGAIWSYNEDLQTPNYVSYVANGSFATKDKRIAFFDYLDTMRFKAVSAGDNTFVLVTESGTVYTVIHSATLNGNITDSNYPRIKYGGGTLNAINGITIKNNYYPGAYNYDININLEETANGYEMKYTTNGSDPWAQGIKYSNPFVMTENNLLIKTVKKNNDGQYIDSQFPIVPYYYAFTSPEIKAVPPAGVQNGEVKVTLSSTRSGYSIYYTTDLTEPISSPTSKKYTGEIVVSKTTTIRAKAVSDTDSTKVTNVYSMFYAIPEGGTSGGSGTTIGTKNYTSDTIWNKSGSPYIITGNVTISSPATLYIAPGVEIRLGANNVINVNGSLVAIGSQDEPIVFKANTTSQWGGINMQSASGNNNNRLEYLNISGATTAINVTTEKTRFVSDLNNLNVHDNAAGVKISANNYKVLNSKFTSNANYAIWLTGINNFIDSCDVIANNTGIYISNNDNTVLNSTIEGNRVYGVNNDNARGTHVNNCIIKGNTSNVNTVSSSVASYSLDFTNNYWGSLALANILAKITDNRDVAYLPIVNFEPFIKQDPTFANAVCEVDENILDQDGKPLTIENLATVKKVFLTVAKIPAENVDAMFVVAMYDKDKNLVKSAVKKSTLIGNEKADQIVIELGVYQYESVDEIKILSWSNDSAIPYARVIKIINMK